jgi:hypothetical protein
MSLNVFLQLLYLTYSKLTMPELSHHFLTAAAWVCTQVSSMGFVVDKVALGQVFL